MAGVNRVAAIDCGTNSIRLLIADAAPEGLTDVTRQMEVVRLGQGVDRTNRLDETALQRTFDAAAGYAQLCESHNVQALRFVATSATRDAQNRDVFTAGIKERLGVEPEVISGEVEASLSFAGAARILGADHPSPALVVDIGGGSTELVLGDAARGRIAGAVSLDVGCVRMSERHFRHDPPTVSELRAAADDIDAMLDRADDVLELAAVRTLVGVAGSVTTVTAHALGLGSYEPETINGADLSIEEVLASCERLWTEERPTRAAYGFMHPGRVDVIAAGALVWSRVITRIAERTASGDGAGLAKVATSEHDILDGIALSLLSR